MKKMVMTLAGLVLMASSCLAYTPEKTGVLLDVVAGTATVDGQPIDQATMQSLKDYPILQTGWREAAGLTRAIETPNHRLELYAGKDLRAALDLTVDPTVMIYSVDPAFKAVKFVYDRQPAGRDEAFGTATLMIELRDCKAITTDVCKVSDILMSFKEAAN